MIALFPSILIGTLAYGLLLKKDLFSPVRFYVVIYAFLLSVYFLKLSFYQTPWSSTSNVVFWGATGMFIAGGALAFLMNGIMNPGGVVSESAIKARLSENAKTINWSVFFWMMIGCGLFFLVTYSYSFWKVRYIPLFHVNPDKSRMDFIGIGLLSYGWFFGISSLMLSAEMLLFAKLTRTRKLFTIAWSIVVTLFYATLISRLDFFRLIIFIVVIFHYGKKRITFKHVCVLLIVGLVLFLSVFLIRLGSNAITSFTLGTKIGMPKSLMWASGFYTYVVNNFWNFDFAMRQYVDGNGYYPQSWGFELFRPLIFLVPGGEAFFQKTFGFDSIFNESVILVPGLNTIVYMWHFYKDFGPIGAFGIPFIASLCLSMFYHNTMRGPTLFRMSIWGVVIASITFSFIVPLWSFWFTYLNLLILAIAHGKLGLVSPKRTIDGQAV